MQSDLKGFLRHYRVVRVGMDHALNALDEGLGKARSFQTNRILLIGAKAWRVMHRVGKVE